MRGTVLRGALGLSAAVAMFALSACARPAPVAGRGAAVAGTPVYDAWTTPPQPGATYAAQPANAAALQPAPRAIGGGALPPPPPPDGRYPVVGVPGGQAPVAAGGAAFPTPRAGTIPATDPRVPAGARGIWIAPERTYTCGLPCSDGISQWHLRGVYGLATYSGTDSAENCSYYGADIGRTFCGCWGWDLYYRYNSGRFMREPTLGATFEDGGEWNHFGTKLTMERQIGGSRIYWWAGLGVGYYTTSNYVANDDGIEGFGEAGLGWNLSRQWRLRAGVNVHGMDTDVTRRLPSNDGQSRWLWIIAPVVEVEFSF